MTLEEYKELLINYYVFDVDNTPEKRAERAQTLRATYTDAYLGKIVADTDDFIKGIIQSKSVNNGHWEYELGKSVSATIYLGLSGLDSNSDVILIDDDNKVISTRMVKHVFGKDFSMRVDNPLTTTDYSLIMDGLPTNMDELQEQYTGRGRV